MGDRIKGFKEQIKGTILRKPELKETGKERMTGELKKKEKEKASYSQIDSTGLLT